MESEIIRMMDTCMLEFAQSVSEKLGDKITKWEVFAIYKWETMIKDRIEEEQGKLFLRDGDSGERFAQIDTNTWDVLYLE